MVLKHGTSYVQTALLCSTLICLLDEKNLSSFKTAIRYTGLYGMGIIQGWERCFVMYCLVQTVQVECKRNWAAYKAMHSLFGTHPYTCWLQQLECDSLQSTWSMLPRVQFYSSKCLTCALFSVIVVLLYTFTWRNGVLGHAQMFGRPPSLSDKCYCPCGNGVTGSHETACRTQAHTHLYDSPPFLTSQSYHSCVIKYSDIMPISFPLPTQYGGKRLEQVLNIGIHWS